MNTNITVALIIDPPLLLEALAIVFRQQFPQITLLTGGRGGDALAMATVPNQMIDLVIVNDVLPDIPAATLLKRLRWYSPQMQTITLALGTAKAGRGVTPLPNNGESMAALLASVRRMLPMLAQTSSMDALAVTSLTMAAVASSAAAFQARTGMGSTASYAAPALPAPGTVAVTVSNTVSLMRHQRLTPRQQEVLSLLAQGWRNRMIADHLHTSEKTVKAHVSAVFQVLDVSNRTQATLAAQRNGLLSA